ncbi:hypothetical protein ACS0TY_022640 [Phlomoides rotata]
MTQISLNNVDKSSSNLQVFTISPILEHSRPNRENHIVFFASFQSSILQRNIIRRNSTHQIFGGRRKPKLQFSSTDIAKRSTTGRLSHPI